MERCVHKYLYNYIIENAILTPFQSGFVRGDSTTNQLLHTYHTFCNANDSGKEVRSVFCDISKAFDRVWHRGLLHKLSGIGCSDKITSWFSSYLTGRKQRVVLAGHVSEWISVLAGVPQGSILGPLLFLIFIIDIVQNLGCSIQLFADDTSLYIIVESPNGAAHSLNIDLNTIGTWAEAWLVAFNTGKALSMIFSRKANPPQHPPLLMNNIVLTETDTHKHLGLTLSNTCTWSNHIQTITTKVWTILNLLRALKFRVSRKSLEQMYISFVRPLLEYCDSVWDNASVDSKKQLDAVHVEAARIITGATKLCSIEKLLSDLGWESLQNRPNIIFYKIINGLTSNYLLDLVPPIIQETTNYNLRNANDIQTLHARTNLYYNSFFPSTIRAWNSLPEDTKQSPSISSFKFRLNRDINKPPKYYNTGTRMGQILHTRIRLECSSLNAHLYRKNIVPEPTCQCGGFESSYHYFFICSIFVDARTRYLPANLNNLTTRDLLFGMENKTNHENEALIMKVQEFIVKSGRFTRN